MRAIALIPVVLASAAFGCSKGSSPSAMPVTSMSGRVVLPSGSLLSVDGLKVVDGVAEATVLADGAFSISRTGFAADGAQLVMVIGPTDKPVLAGYLDSTHATVSARTTAEFLAWFATGCFLLPYESQPQALQALRDADLLEAIEAAIVFELATNPEALAGPSPAIEAALAGFVRLVQNVPDTTNVQSPLVLVNPAQERSGVRIDQPSGINTIQLVNSYRRRGYVFLERVSYVDANDQVVEAPEPIADHYLAASTGLNGAIGTFVDIFNGNYAYTPTADEVISLALVDGAKKTTFRVSVVGLGAHLGDFDRLTDEQKDKAEWVWYVTGFWDVLLPLTVNVIMPVATYSGADGILDDVATSDIIGDVLNIVSTIPGAKDALLAGNLKDFVHIVFATVTTGNAQLQKRLVGAAIDFVFQLQLAEVVSDEQVMAFNRALGYAGQILNGLNVVNILTGAADFGVVATHVGMSDLGDIWTVDATLPKVKLEPASTTLQLTESTKLKAVVVEATGSGEAPTLAYRWTHSGSGGSIQDEHGHSGSEFDSSDATVTFVADGEVGSDTVGVEVFWVKMGSGPTERVSLGKATASIDVKAAVWDAGTDFSGTSNPNGAWGYGWSATLGSDFMPFENTITGACGSVVWGAQGTAGTPSVWKNLCSDEKDGVAPGQVSLHPGCDADEYVILRWTAPSDGRFHFDAIFYYGDHGGPQREPNIGETDAYILKNKTVMESFVSTDGNPHWIGVWSLTKGDAIDFAVGTKGECGFDNTPLDVVITPE